MDVNTEIITAQEFDWITNNEPTFQIYSNKFIGKVGRAPNGEDIRIEIILPKEYYPFIKPEVKVLTRIEHPNIEINGGLALQLLDDWIPQYRIKDIIAASRRLFVKSKNVIKIPNEGELIKTPSDGINELKNEIQSLQNQINKHSQEITNVKVKKLETAGVSTTLSGAIPISSLDDLEATKFAIIDLLELIEDKFEDAAMNEIAFFRLYRKYIKEQYLVDQKLKSKGEITNVVSEQKTQRSIGN